MQKSSEGIVLLSEMCDGIFDLYLLDSVSQLPTYTCC